MTATCKVKLQPRGNFDAYDNPRRCGRRVIENDLCSLHLKAQWLREAKQERRKAEQEAQRERRLEALNLAGSLVDLGIPDKPEPEYYTGNLVITPEAAQWLIEKVGR